MKEFLVDLPQCAGTLSWGDVSLPVRFALRCARDGATSVEVESIPLSAEARALFRRFGERGLHTADYVLSGDAASGERVRCDSARLLSCSPRPQDGTTFLAVTLHCPALTVTLLRETVEHGGPSTEYWVAGLRCFRMIHAAFDFGNVTVKGATNHTTDLSGLIAVEPQPGLSRDEVDDGVERVLDILSVAGGLRLSWTVRQVADGDSVEATLIPRVPVATPKWPAFHLLELEPLLSCAGANYTRELVERTGIGLAIKWAFAETNYEEVAFLQLMTAVEHLVERFSEGDRVDHLTKSEFRKLRGDLEDAVKEFAAASAADARIEAACRELVGGLSHLNRGALKKNIAAMLAAYNVPTSGLTHYPELVDLRNAIVHTGLPTRTRGKPLPDVVEGEVALRELIVRTLLALITYKGRYRSWLNGPAWSDFPEPAKSAGTESKATESTGAESTASASTATSEAGTPAETTTEGSSVEKTGPDAPRSTRPT